MIVRNYKALLQNHIDNYEQMLFICGSRQVGKTTLARQFITSEKNYLNWDNVNHREIILGDIFTYLEKEVLARHHEQQKPIIVLDEIHKYSAWKNYLKGIYDQYKGRLLIMVTGSAKLDVYHKGGDSLMGRYFLYPIYPLSVAELCQPLPKRALIQPACAISDKVWQQLWDMGGYPEPYSKADQVFHQLWTASRLQQLFQEEIRDYAKVQDIAQLELLGKLIADQTGSQLNYSNLAKKIRKPEITVRAWYQVLQNAYYCFSISPWSRNIARAILKTPKAYLYDWSVLKDKGARVENFMAVHLRKAVDYWQASGQGTFGLYYLRDKEKREVDFLICKDDEPWIMLEMKSQGKVALSDHLAVFQQQVKAEYVFQVAYDLPSVEVDFFVDKQPKIVPMRSFLGQLV